MAERDVYLQGLIADQVLGQEAQQQTNQALVQDVAVPENPADYETPAQGSFTAGLRSGANSFASNLQYFSALGNTLLGREEAAALDVEQARAREGMAANAVQGFETFEEFTDAPTFGGFIDQVGLGLGQVTPYAAETIATVLVGAATGGLGYAAAAGKATAKAGLSEGTELVAKKLVKDLVQKRARGEQLDMFEEEAANAVWGAFKKGAGRGALAGQIGGTYPLNTGESFGEFDDAGVDLTADRALQSLLVGAGSTAIEVAGERLVFGKLADLAKSKAGPDESSILNLFAKNIGRGAGIGAASEGATELAQEGLLVGQRLAVDENYSMDDATMRLGQAAFLGTIAGTAMGGGGGALATTPEAATRVFDKARELSRQGRSQQVDEDMMIEQYGSLNSVFTTPESEADLNAQFDAMQDEQYGKQAVWVAGENFVGPDAPEQGQVTRNNQQLYYAHIAGRGTIFSPDANIVNEVVTSNASDPSLAKALGYSGAKSMEDGPDVVVQARNADGVIISEEITTREGVFDAVAAADRIAGSNGSSTVTSLEKAQRDRASRYNQEQSRQMVVDEEALPETDPDATPEQDQGFGEVDVEETAIGEDLKPYSPRKSWDTEFEGTQAARDNYNSVFGTDINWSRSPLGLASDAALNKAAELQGRNPQTVVSLVQSSDGSFNIEANQLDGSLYTIQDRNGNQRRLPLGEFIAESLKRMAKRSKFANATITETKEGGKSQKVNLMELINTGKRINGAETGASFEGRQADADGLSTIMAVLAEQGYTLEVNGEQLQGASRGAVPESYKEITINKKGKTLYEVMTNTKRLPKNAEQTVVNDKGKTLAQVLEDRPQSSVQELSPSQQQRLIQLEKSIDNFQYNQRQKFLRENLNVTREQVEQFDAIQAKAKADRLRDEEISFGFARDEMVDTASSASARQRNVPAAPEGEDGTGGGRPTELFNQGIVLGTDAEGNTVQLGQEVSRIPDDLPAPEGEVDLAQIARQEGTQATRTNVEMGENRLSYKETAPREEVDPDAIRQSAEEWLSENKQAEVFGVLPQTVKSLLNTMLKRLRLRGKVAVMTTSELQQASLGNGRYKFGNRVVDLSSNPAVARAVENAITAGAKVPGTYIPMPQKGGGMAHLVVLNDAALTNEAELALTMAHELGHAFYKEEVQKAIENPQLRSRLYRDFQRALEKDPDLYAGYEEDVAFEEWVADQTAKWGASELKARGVVQRFFQALAEKLRTMWNSMRDTYKRRFGQEYSQTFDEFVKDVIRRKDRDSVSAVPDNSQSALNDIDGPSKVSWLSGSMKRDDSALDNLAGNVFEPVRQMRVNSIRDAVHKAAQLLIGNKGIKAMEEADLATQTAKAWEGLMKVVLPTQQRLRALGKKTGAGVRISNMMYGRSGERGLGFVQRTTLQINQLQSRLEDLFGGNLDYFQSKDFKDAAREAASSRPTASLSPDAQKIRNFLEEIYDDYIAKEPNTNIQKQADYFPVMLDLDLVEGDIDTFAQIISAQRGDLTPQQVKDRIAEAVEKSKRTPKESLKQGIDPLHAAEEAIELTRGVDRESIAGFMKPPDEVVMQYMKRTVKRVEWNRATKGGETTLAQEMALLDPDEREDAYRSLGALLGFYVPMNPTFRTASSAAQTIQIWTTLSLATLSSIPELATAIVATREFGGIMGGFREIINTITNPRERYEFAREIGVVANDSMANAFMSEADLQYMDETSRAFADFFFKYTGLEIFTRFTRVFAAGMAEKFIESHALNPRNRSERYLDELGLNADIVKQWIKEGKGFDSDAGQLVKQGLQKFVESTMLRPNAAERPAWASDPRYAILWQLKSFPYSYGQVVIGGVVREMKARQAEGRAAGKSGTEIIAQDMLPHLALFGAAVLPFAMLSLELKEYTKYSMGAILPFAEADSRVFRTDNMDWSEYFMAAYGAAGVFGPLALLTSAQTDIKWGKPPVSIFGPTVDMLYQVLIQGDLSRATPIYNQFG